LTSTHLCSAEEETEKIVVQTDLQIRSPY